MIYNDAHIHIGDYSSTKEILKNSPYLNKYKVYSCIDPETIKKQDTYLKTIHDFFAMPIMFKETNIQSANEYITDFCARIGKGIPVTILNDNEYFNDNLAFSIMKEHFLLHDANEYRNRALYYEYLNNNDGFLILHCKDKIRINYIRQLRNSFPKMNIIIAHLGRNTIENHQDILRIIKQFKDDKHIFFDISTINNIETILMAISIAGSDRVLYGSDFPYEFDLDKEMTRRSKLEEALAHDYDTLVKLSGDNFEKIKSRIRRK